MKKDYIINEETLFLEQVFGDVRVMNMKKECILEKTLIKKVLENSCIFYGCTFQGRKDGTKKLLNENYKLPIILKENNLVIIFPLNSLRTKACIWINYNNILKYVQMSKGRVIVYFKNGKNYTFNVSYYIFHNQILKCSRLIVIYNNRNQ